MERIVMVDFAGTLILPEVIEEANLIRSEVIKRAIPDAHEHANPEELYKANREAVSQITGFTEDMSSLSTQPDGSTVSLTGRQMLNQLSTNWFQMGMLRAASKYKASMFPEGMLDALQVVKDRGYKLGIVSGVRTDIIDPMLRIAGCTLFDHIYGQPATLGISNEENMKRLSGHGKITHIIGDKLSDLEPAKIYGAKTIWVTWGHPSGGEKQVADYTVSHATELSDIIQ